VTELTQHDTDDGFHEIQLSGKQLVFLFMMATTVLVMTFLCGVWVGRGVPNDRAGDNPDMAAATPPPAATPSQPAASSGPPSSEPPAPAVEPDDELSYAKRLQADSAPVEKLKPPASTPAASTAKQPAPVAVPAPAPAKPEPAAPPSTGRAGAWIVQVVSLQDRAAAAQIAKRLTAKGYPAFVLDPPSGGPRIYRVQVGGYSDKNDAEQASRRLERDEQLKPFVRSR
jgi:cell division septation protein DedD